MSFLDKNHFHFEKLSDLKEYYTHFYYELMNYIKAVPEYEYPWCFVDCYDREYDGTLFIVAFNNQTSKRLDIVATKDGQDYKFVYTINDWKPKI